VIPTIVAFLKVPHQSSMLTGHLADMRRFMPAGHRAVIERVEALPGIRDKVDKGPFNDALEALASFRETHLQFAIRYIAAHERDPRGTGGTPYMRWLGQLIDETRAFKIP
jgi:indoleamine 2,3-dioxygenase